MLKGITYMVCWYDETGVKEWESMTPEQTFEFLRDKFIDRGLAIDDVFIYDENSFKDPAELFLDLLKEWRE